MLVLEHAPAAIHPRAQRLRVAVSLAVEGLLLKIEHPEEGLELDQVFEVFDAHALSDPVQLGRFGTAILFTHLSITVSEHVRPQLLRVALVLEHPESLLLHLLASAR